MKTYLGDGVYAEVDELARVVLTTENGYCATNTIYLENDVWGKLVQWAISEGHLRLVSATRDTALCDQERGPALTCSRGTRGCSGAPHGDC